MGKKEGFDDSIIGNDIVQFQFYNKIDTTILQKIDKEVERYKKKEDPSLYLTWKE